MSLATRNAHLNKKGADRVSPALNQSEEQSVYQAILSQDISALEALLTTTRIVLVAGVKTVTDARIASTSNVLLWRQVDGGTVGASYSVAITTGQVIVTSKDGVGVTNTSDTSTLVYLVLDPA